MGVLALDELVRCKADIVGVIARHDDPSEGQWYPSVTKRAETYGLEVFKPQDINDPEFVAQVRAIAPDLLFTAFYSQIYKRRLLEVVGSSINLHFAPLPRYRGSYPGAWAIINGESQHGVTLHYMDPGVDSGDIIAQIMVDISPRETGLSLYDKCEKAGLDLLRETWPKIAAGDVQPTPQDQQAVLYHDRTYPYGGVINFNWTAQQINNYVRAMTFPPFANPFTFFSGRKLTVLKAEMADSDKTGDVGKILDVDGLSVQTREGVVRLIAFADNRGKTRSLDEIIKNYEIRTGEYLGW
jgi:UDP-4-amino-4-deoxy-L-arabinose formyltransferase/UDP-glucuronic acid dehydrogenase (UDP-4-keto-hexauronic acid decarboxylating)